MHRPTVFDGKSSVICASILGGLWICYCHAWLMMLLSPLRSPYCWAHLWAVARTMVHRWCLGCLLKFADSLDEASGQTESPKSARSQNLTWKVEQVASSTSMQCEVNTFSLTPCRSRRLQLNPAIDHSNTTEMQLEKERKRENVRENVWKALIKDLPFGL